MDVSVRDNDFVVLLDTLGDELSVADELCVMLLAVGVFECVSLTVSDVESEALIESKREKVSVVVGLLELLMVPKDGDIVTDGEQLALGEIEGERLSDPEADCESVLLVDRVRDGDFLVPLIVPVAEGFNDSLEVMVAEEESISDSDGVVESLVDNDEE